MDNNFIDCKINVLLPALAGHQAIVAFCNLLLNHLQVNLKLRCVINWMIKEAIKSRPRT